MSASRLRVLQVTPRYAPDNGGVESHVEHLSLALLDHGVEVTVATTGAGPRSEQREGIEVRRFGAIAPGGNYHASAGLFRYIRAHRAAFDVIHAHSYHSLTTTVAAMTSGSTPLVITPHYHGAGHSRLRDALHVPYSRVGRWMLRRAAAVIAVSAAEQELLLEFAPGIAGRCEQIGNGIDERFLTASPPLSRDAGLILAVGRLEAYKRFDLIIEALRELPPSFHLEIVGRGPEEQALRRIAETRGLASRIGFRANLSDAELAESYRRAAVYVSLSAHEAFGLTLLEAAASGCPVVASDIPSHRELAGMASGIVLAHSTEAAIVAGLIAAQAGVTASLRDPGRLRWSSVAEATVGVYRRILSPSPHEVPA